MPTLSAAELASMRGCVSETMPDVATIERNTPVDDGQGGETGAWASAGTSACELLASSAHGEVLRGGKLVSVTLWRVRFPYGTDVRPEDRLVIGGRTYEIANRDTGRSNGLSVVVNCTRED